MEETRAPSGPADSDGTTVLVVDDDRRVRTWLRRVLDDQGFSVREASNGEQALSLAQRERPGIALVDLSMPVMSGFDVVSSLKSDFGASLHALVLSGRTDGETRSRAFRSGADDFVAKPADVPELIGRVRAAARTVAAFEAAEEARREADRLRLYASEAAALLAHDLNNGFAVAQAYLQELCREDSMFSERQRDEAMFATRLAVERMGRLVTNFVDMGRLEDGMLVPRLAEVGLERLLSDTATLHKQASTRSTQFTVRCDYRGTCVADAALLERLLHNLVGNSLRYVNDGGAIRIIATQETSSTLLIEVANTGAPVPEALQERIFEKYAIGKDGKSRCGMGLYFCRLVSECHGGSIALRHDSGWTRFLVRLPLS